MENSYESLIMFSFFKAAYQTKRGFLKSRINDKLREATLHIYPNGLFIVAHAYDFYEAYPSKKNPKFIYDIATNQNDMKFYQFIATE